MDYPLVDPSTLPQQQNGQDMKQQLFAAMMKQNMPQGGRYSTGKSNAYDAVNALASAYAMKQIKAKQAAQQTGAQTAPVQGWGNTNTQSVPPMQPVQQPAPVQQPTIQPVVGPQSTYMP